MILNHLVLSFIAKHNTIITIYGQIPSSSKYLNSNIIPFAFFVTFVVGSNSSSNPVLYRNSFIS